MLIQLLMLAVALHVVLWRHQAVMEYAWRRWTLIVLSLCGLLGVCAWLLGGNQGLSRWQSFSMRGFDDPARRHAASMAVQMGDDAAWTGEQGRGRSRSFRHTMRRLMRSHRLDGGSMRTTITRSLRGMGMDWLWCY